MATSGQWRHASLMVAATYVAVFYIGFADATSCYSVRNCQGRANAITECIGGVCTYSCKPGWTNCDNDWSNGCEVNTDTDVNANCGSCGRQCIPYHPSTVITACIKGQCVYTCKAGLSDCNNWLNDGCESRLPYNNDLRFCGACDTPCLMDLPNAVSKCNRGKCEYTCNLGYGNCDKKWPNGCEKDLTMDIHNCGKCGLECKVTLQGGEATCRKSTCGQQCKTGTTFDSNTNTCIRSY